MVSLQTYNVAPIPEFMDASVVRISLSSGVGIVSTAGDFDFDIGVIDLINFVHFIIVIDFITVIDFIDSINFIA